MPERFIGGLRLFRKGTETPRVISIWSLNATRPLAELLVDDQRVLLRMRWGWLRGFARIFRLVGLNSVWEAPRSTVSVEKFGRFLFTAGIHEPKLDPTPAGRAYPGAGAVAVLLDLYGTMP